MNLESIVAFAIVIGAWALLPGPGLVMVLSRSLAYGMGSGFAVVTGLVAADLVFLLVAVVGLSAIATTLGPLFQFVKYAGAAYLVWRGLCVLLHAAKPMVIEIRPRHALLQDVGIGLLVTLGNPKAILFFGALLPMVLDIKALGVADFLVLSAVVAFSSFAVYGTYMIVSARTRRLLTSSGATIRLRQAAGVTLVGSGIVVATR